MKLLAAALCAITMALAVGGPRGLPTRTTNVPASSGGHARGRCLVVVPRGEASEPAWAADLCDAPAGAAEAVAKEYAWLPEYLAGAVDAAETTICGGPGCALHDRTVRFYVVPTEFPFLSVRRQDTRISVVITTGTIRVVEGAVAAAATGHLTAWLGRMGGGAGESCRTSAVSLDPAGRAGARSFYELVVGNEIARLRLGAQCGEGEQAAHSERNAACQAAAWEYLRERVSPESVIAGDLALAHFQSRNRYAWALHASGEPVLDRVARLLPSDWSARAAILARERDDDFAHGRMPPFATDLRNALALPRPRACGSPTTPTSRAKPADVIGDPSARACLGRAPHTGAEVEWDSDGDPILARVRLAYRNTCSRPIRCALTALLGTTNGTEQAGDTLTLMPQAETEFTGVLAAPSRGGIPHLRFPDDGDGRDLARCDWL